MTIDVRRQPSLKLGQTVTIGATSFTADVSVSEGGDDAGPNPHDLYDAALGACEALTVMWYATRKGIPVEDIMVSVDRDSSEERAGTYRLTARLKLKGAFSDAQLAELRAVAEKCPVRKLMTTVTTVVQSEVERME